MDKAGIVLILIMSASNQVRQFFRFMYFLILRFERNENRKNAAALTFVSLFAIVPLMTSGYAVLQLIPEFQDVSSQIEDFLFKHFIPASGESLQVYLAGFSEQAGKLTWIGIVILLFSAMSLMFTIENAFNRVWRVTTVRIGRRLVLYWLVIVLGPLLLAAGILLSGYIFGSRLWLEHFDSWSHVNALLFSILPFLISSLFLCSMYYWLPACKVRFQDAFLGGVVTALVLELCKDGFVAVVSELPSYRLIYGAFAVVPLFLLWIYLAWCVVLLGAEFVRFLPFIHKEWKGLKASQLDWALLILQVFKVCDKNYLPRYDLLAALPIVNADEWEVILNQLVNNHWLLSHEDGFELNIDLQVKTVGELSELILEKDIQKFALQMHEAAWFTVLMPTLSELKLQKKAALGLPIYQVV